MAVEQDIRNEVESILPCDDLEAQTRQDVLAWIDSGAQLCRIRKPATPARHLVSYVLLVDGDHVLLVDHKNAGLWLPAGGHVEPGEHPRQTALREALEELSVRGEFLCEHPLFITSNMTVGKTAGHIDVAIWYLLRGDRQQDISFDRKEFHGIRWFHREQVPFDRADPGMRRFLAKLYA